MKITNLIIRTITVLALASGAVSHAEVLQYLTINLTTFSQREIIDDGTNSTALAPRVQSHNTAQLLEVLAQDKNAQGLWPSNSFPAKTKLAVTGEGTFIVVNGTNVLVDVSDILSFHDGDHEVVSGKKNDGSGLSNPTTKRLHIGRLDFDDTGITGGAALKFYLQGVVSDSRTDTKPVNNVYTQSVSGKLTNGAGEGTSEGTDNFILTGTITATGKGPQTLPP